MALIQVTGYITDNLAPQTGQSGRPYVRFELLEITGSGKKRWTQYYQVWTWGYEEVDRLMKLGVKKDCKVQITGTLKLVDAYTKASGKTKQLKVALEDCQLLADPVALLLHKPDKAVTDYPIRDLDGDRDVLPE